MKKVFWIKPIIFATILLLVACKKEEFPGDVEYEITHWPVVKTLKATNLKAITATLNGTVNCYGLSTIVTFEYGTTSSYDSTVTASQSPITGDGINSIINVSANISGLIPSTTYHFRVKAENSKWINFYGSDSTFITSDPVTSLEATIVDSTAARLNATIDSLGISTIVTFDYGTTTSYGNTVEAFQSPISGDDIINVSADITGLIPSTRYHFRIRTENPLWNFSGSDQLFNTGPWLLPVAITLEATNISSTGATLNGRVFGPSTNVVFTYYQSVGLGRKPNLITGSAIPGQISGTGLTNVSLHVTGLISGRQYWFKVEAYHSCGGVGRVDGELKSFITQ